MPRPREFDEQEVVARAVREFRRRGYHATSTRDLGDALGLSPSSLYRTFGDKHALFLRALDRYQADETGRMLDHLASAGSVRDVLRAWVATTVAPPDDPDAALGCLVINTATELGTGDADCAARIGAAFDGMRDTLAELLRRGVASGELPADLDADAAADLLFTTLTGLRVRLRAGHDPDRLRAVADRAIRSLTAGDS